MSAQDQLSALRAALARVPLAFGDVNNVGATPLLAELSNAGWELARRDEPRLSPNAALVDGLSDGGVAEGDSTAGGNHDGR